ncbi:hypothetical protein D3C81_1546650 [compost metagenome]
MKQQLHFGRSESWDELKWNLIMVRWSISRNLRRATISNGYNPVKNTSNQLGFPAIRATLYRYTCLINDVIAAGAIGSMIFAKARIQSKIP